MRAVDAVTVKTIRALLEASLDEEAKAERNLLPTEPGWPQLASQRALVAKFLENQLRSGLQLAPEVETSARKIGHGVRPVPYWGPAERVVYRAIVHALERSINLTFDRSVEAYKLFVEAPIQFAYDLDGATEPWSDAASSAVFTPLDSQVKYVVKGDVAAYYQYIDHSILAEELLAQGAPHYLVEVLLDLLQEVQGRTYGIPQLLDPSDALSEVYAARLERDLLRTGFRTWRYNDDVRIACLSYEEALEAIEAFDHSARKIGLIANENKTVIVGFVRYTSDAYGLEISDAETIHRDEVEIALGDYAVGFMKEPAKALAFVRSTGVSGAYDVDLRNVKSDDVRKLRRAIGGLASAAHPGGLEYMPMLLRYVPSLTPSVMKYVESVHDAIPEAAEEVLDEFRRGVSKSAWQRMWLVHTLGQVGALQDPERSQWVRSQLESAMSAPLRATCVLALAASGALSLRDVLDHANAAPPALLPFYASAVAGAVRARGGEMPPEATAFKDASLLHRALVSDPIS